jgi:serine acetyltransferase
MSGSRVRSFVELARSDVRANRKNPKGQLILLAYRLAHTHLSAPPYLKPFTLACVACYKLLTEFGVGADIPWRCEIGPSARIFHGFGLVIHGNVKIGSHVVLRNGVTIGMSRTSDIRVPVIGDYVEIGVGASILGAITVGDHAVIGAGAVVVRDVPPYAVVVGNPSRIVRIGVRPPAHTERRVTA